MTKFFIKQYNKIREKMHSFKLDTNTPLQRLGSDYGGWLFPKGQINAQSICYFAGAGTDVSFDLEMAKHHNPNIYIFDPTPGAITHFNETKDGILSGKTMFTQGKKYKYPSLSTFDKIHFFDYGVWDKNETLKFYVPANKDFISHSVKNLNKTSEYFDAKVKSLSTIMAELGHDHIDLLKIDIEGAEYEVLNDIVTNQIPIRAICVEFDESFMKNIDSNYLKRIIAAVQGLKSAGYKLAHIEKPFDMTFIKE